MFVFVVLMVVIKSTQVKDIVGIIIISYVVVKRNENLGMKNMGNNISAKNILNEGLKIISAGTSDYKGGEEIRR